jgi:hypothetical protein
MRLQFNPGRLTSTAAKLDPQSVAQRKCFLCPAQLPPEQRGLAFNPDWVVLCNPFPIFPEHFTIVHRDHLPQRITGSFGVMLDLAKSLASRYTVFYNGPRCGASAPDHLHFQAGDKGFMNIEAEYDRLKGTPIARSAKVQVYAPDSLRPFVSLESDDRDALDAAFTTAFRNLANIAPASDEPMVNIVTSYDAPAGGNGGRWRTILFPRTKHRPSFYSAEGDARIMLSPATVELGGVCILPLEQDFRKLHERHLEQMLREVMLFPEPFARLRDALSAVIR